MHKSLVWPENKVKIDYNKCISCKRCTQECGWGVYSFDGKKIVPDEMKCRACGRCVEVCPYQAIHLRLNRYENWVSEVDEALCKGCGNCISVCPTNAADSPYRDQAYLEQIIEEVLV